MIISFSNFFSSFVKVTTYFFDGIDSLPFGFYAGILAYFLHYVNSNRILDGRGIIYAGFGLASLNPRRAV